MMASLYQSGSSRLEAFTMDELGLSIFIATVSVVTLMGSGVLVRCHRRCRDAGAARDACRATVRLPHAAGLRRTACRDRAARTATGEVRPLRSGRGGGQV